MPWRAVLRSLTHPFQPPRTSTRVRVHRSTRNAEHRSIPPRELFGPLSLWSFCWVIWSNDVKSLSFLLFVINSRTAIAGAIIDLLLVFLFRRRDFCYNHMTSPPLQICFLFVLSCNFNWRACVKSFFALSGASFLFIRVIKFLVTLENDFLTLKLTFIYFNSKRFRVLPPAQVCKAITSEAATGSQDFNLHVVINEEFINIFCT